MKFWPPLLWLPVYIASELILLGSHHRWELLTAGGFLALMSLASSLWLSLKKGDEHPRPRWFFWAIGGVALCYVAPAVAAARLGTAWAIGALSASVIPITAVSLLLATVRYKTVATDSGFRDVSDDSDDRIPGIGMDEGTELGDTPEHSDAIDESGPVDLAARRRRARRH